MKNNRFTRWVVKHKKPLLIGFGVLIVIFLVLAAMGVFSSEPVERTETAKKKQEKEQPTTVASPLTGAQVDPESAKRPVTAVVIENSPDARPQSGLKNSGFVFEAIAEGGITRFVAFYQEQRPSLVGPVRSLRPYFNDMILTHDASIAHVGGSAAALAEVPRLNIKDLDQFSNGGAYWRSPDRYAPHNVYTNFDNLDDLNEAKGFDKSNFDSLPRKKDKPADNPNARNITVDISSSNYQSSYTYDKQNNRYKRSQGGAAHDDRENGQINPSVVIVIKAPYSIVEGGRYDYDLTGSGEAFIFQNGNAQKGTWSRSDRESQFVYKSQGGSPIKFVPGQTWMTVLGPDRAPTWSP